MNFYKYTRNIIVLIMLLPMAALANPINVGAPKSARLDGGLILLIISGVGYGSRKLQQKRKINNVY